MRPKVLAATFVVAASVLIVLREIGWSRKVEQAQLANRDLSLAVQQAQTKLSQVEARLARLESGTRHASPADSSPGSLRAPDTRVAQLEEQIRSITNLLSNSERPGRPRRQHVLDFTGGEHPALGNTESTSGPNDTQPRPDWGPEQAVGPPDTPNAGDHATAWAPREPDTGPEWLSLAFEKPVQMAEVRIRETYNPGAVTKVTAIVNGAEQVLWQGAAPPGQAPRDFTVPVSGNVWSQNIIVHFDTARVPGWNEVDAVELIGRDGSRQWASAARASSSYANRNDPIGALTGQLVPGR